MALAAWLRRQPKKIPAKLPAFVAKLIGGVMAKYQSSAVLRVRRSINSVALALWWRWRRCFNAVAAFRRPVVLPVRWRAGWVLRVISSLHHL